MTFKLYKKSRHYMDIKCNMHYDVLIIPSIKRPVFKNIKKEKGKSWTNKYLRWYFMWNARWLVWDFEIKLQG